MINVKTAKTILQQHTPTLPFGKKKVAKALGYVLSKDIVSKVDMPFFDQSAMDGFAICITAKDLDNEELTLPIIGEIKAGDSFFIGEMSEGTAMRIFTGAPVPKGAFCIIMQEKVIVEGDHIRFLATAIKPESNIRRKASLLQKGALALPKFTSLNPAAIGFLASMGLEKIEVFKKPKIAILLTGDELQKAGKPLREGQIYESNAVTLQVALQQDHFDVKVIKKAADEKAILLKKVNQLLEKTDILLISGGISVGKYDLVKDVLAEIGVTTLIHKVAQKPGKPIFVGKKGQKMIFALPGNPAAIWVCFYTYVLPALRQMSGVQKADLLTFTSPLAHDFDLNSDKDLLLKAKFSEGNVTFLEGKDTSLLQPFAQANAIAFLPAGEKKMKRGDVVEVWLL
jgi:molybdopterin molybdotransferase